MPQALIRLILAIMMTLGALLGTAAPAQADVRGPAMMGKPLNVCVRRVQPGDDPARLIRQPQRFDCRTPQLDLGPGDYWVISGNIDERSRSRRPLVTRIGSVWQDRLSLHILYADGRMATMADDNRGITRRIQLGAIIEHELPRYRSPVKRLMWKSEGAANLRGIVIGPRLATAQESARANLAMAVIYSAFGGLALALLAYNLALWAALRHRFQLAYGIMVAVLMAYAFTSSGALGWVVPGIANNDRLRLNYVLLAFAAAAALGFARTFFEPHVFGPRLRMAVNVTIGLMAGAGIAYAVFAPRGIAMLDLVYNCVFLILPVTTIAIMWSAWRNRSNYLWLFAIAWAAPIGFASLRALANFGWIGWSFWLDNSTILSMAAEALLSSVAIAYRIRILRQERDAAVAAEAVARRLAAVDPLTGLLNRRAFLAAALGRSGQQTLMLLDLDHFKQVNETLGHDGGDEVLRIVARTIRTLSSDTALAARMGGEEFAILCDPEHEFDPNILLARLRATRMPFDLRVTASIGSATGPLATESDWKTLYRQADSALFAAKSAGRDRARIATIAA